MLSELDARALEGTPYRFIRVLGHGGMSLVVEAEHVGLAQRVVVKLLRADLSARNDLIERLRLEAQSMARLAHLNLVRVSDFGRTPAGRAYLAMERLEGKTLAHELRDRDFIPVGEAVAWLEQALAGLHAAHSMGLVHRDVKPENLFVCDGPPRSVKVLDFGIAKLSADAALTGVQPLAHATREGVAIGTPRFTAPEQIRGDPVTPATDVYAAGLVLYELVVGRHPFAGRATTDAIYHAQLLEMPPPPSRVARQAISPALDAVVLRAIAKAPADRFASAEAFSNALEAAAHAPLEAPAAIGSRQAPTLGSEMPTLASAGAPDPIEPVRVPNVEVVQLASTAPPAPSAIEPPTVRYGPSEPAAAPKPETLGILSIVLGLVGVLSQIMFLLMAIRELVDPLEFVTSVRGPPRPEAVEDVETWSRIGSAFLALQNLLILAMSLALIAVGVALVRRLPKGPGFARLWSTWALVAVGFGVLADGIVVAIRTSLLGDLVPTTTSTTTEIATSVGWALGIVLLVGVTALEVFLILGIRLWAGKLQRSAGG